MNTWTLYKTKPFPNFPSETYFWLENGIVKYQRENTSLGCVPVNLEDCIGNTIKEVRESFPDLKFTKVKTKMNQEQLSKGWLIL